MKKILLFMASCLLAFNACAEPKSKLDFVTSVKLDGVELASPVNIQSLPAAFWGDGVTTDVGISECTGNGEVNIEYKNKKVVRLEFFSEENQNLNLNWDQVFAEKDAYKNYPLKARIWISWDDMQGFTEALKVGGKLIKPGLTFDEFKKRFPVSAQDEAAYCTERPGDSQDYAVLIGAPVAGFQVDELAYVAHVRFAFKHGKLFQLFIFQGIAC
jgi:hypothetical protein